MTPQSQTLVKSDKDPRTLEYVPFGADSKIKLSVKIIQDLVCIPTKSGKICSERDAIKFMMLCQARGLNPFEGDAYLQGYDGREGPQFSLITAHQAFLKRAELHPEYDGMESGVVVLNGEGAEIERQGDYFRDDEDLVGSWSRVHFKNRKVPMYKKLKFSTFKKNYGVWESNPEGMIVKCAEADALRSSFPTKLGGLYLAEEQTRPAASRIDTHVSAPMLEASIPLSQIQDASQESETATSPTGPTPQDELFAITNAEGYTYEELCIWAKAGGHIEDAKIKPEDFPADVAKRLTRAKVGMLRGLAQFREEAKAA